MSTNAFDPVPSPFNFSQAEKDIIAFWKAGQTYHKSLAQRAEAPRFVFYEGPPTANGMPHPGHCLTRTIKDIFPRYKTMAGYYCERKAGWDTHGLPVEIEVCKELGIIDGGKEAIEKFGIEKFNRTCIESVFRYKKEWEQLTDRIGFWVDLDEAYVTFHQSYVESVWWALKTLFDRGLLYQGHKVVWWWAQGGTALSAGEVGEGYRDVDDPAITVRLALTDAAKQALNLEGEDASLLIWTTTPWTLSSNCAACVGPDTDYAVVKHATEGGHEMLILASALVGKHFGEDAEIVGTFKGTDLLGLGYKPLFDYGTPVSMENPDATSEKHWVVIAGDFVDLETGTGIVHMAPAFGEDDYRVCKEKGIGFLCFVKPDGTFDARVTDVDPYDKASIAGQFCKAADKGIIRILKERGQLFKHEQYKHSYPFCPRAENDPLIQYARKSWFIKTSQFKGDFVANNKEIAWQPAHIRDGRFGNFLENNVDWALSRERYWGTPLPVWICDKTGQMDCISSYAELLAKPGVEGTEVWAKAKAESPELSEHLKVHKPYIDAVSYQSPHDPAGRMRRVTEVIDVWFDAGSMPFAQWGYPHVPGSEEKFNDRFPADFISEAIDQTRGWFYALLAISTVVHGKDKAPWPHPFKNCICLGHILGEDGLKLSKRLKNYSEPGLLFEKFSADALRWSFIAKNPPTNSSRLSERIVEESQRELLMRWYNVYSFFVIYANLDGFDPATAPNAVLRELFADHDAAPAGGTGGDAPWRPAAERAELDRWILSELDRVIVDARAALDAYETYPAAREISGFVDSLSNWYVRRSRARFWASGWSADKADAYWTLFECLIKLARLAAPFVPFFAEVTWRNLAKPVPGAAESVHLTVYPQADAANIDRALLDQMALTREAVNLGLSARRVENIKVRQPLGLCELVVSSADHRAALANHLDLIKEELNIKEVAFTDSPEEYVSYEIRPNFKVLGPRFGKNVQQARQALANADGAALFAQLQSGGISIEIDGKAEALSQEEVDVRLTPKEGFAAAQGSRLVVVISTEITEALKREGLVREVVRALQDIRKEQNLAYDARIQVTIETNDDALNGAIAEFKDYIAQEVLANSLECGPAGDGAKVVEIEGSEVRLSAIAESSLPKHGDDTVLCKGMDNLPETIFPISPVESIASAVRKSSMNSLLSITKALEKEQEQFLKMGAIYTDLSPRASILQSALSIQKENQALIKEIANAHQGLSSSLSSSTLSTLARFNQQWIDSVTKSSKSLLSKSLLQFPSSIAEKYIADFKGMASIEIATFRTESLFAQATKAFEMPQFGSSVFEGNTLKTALAAETRAFEALFRAFASTDELPTFNFDMPFWIAENRLGTLEVINLTLPESTEANLRSDPKITDSDVTELVDDVLGARNRYFLQSLQGAREVLRGGGIDCVRHASISLRELLEHLIRSLAPEEEATSWAISKKTGLDKSGKATRESRFRYICRSLPTNKMFADFLQWDIQCYNNVMSGLQSGAHGMPSSLAPEDVEVLIAKVECLVILLIRLEQTNT